MKEKEKLSLLKPKLNQLLSKNSFDFLSFEDSDSFQLKSEEWPSDKWSEKLYFQTEIMNTKSIGYIITNFLSLIEGSFLYVFLMNFNFGLIKISKDELLKNWKNLIELDKDEIFLYNPKRN